MTRIEGVDLSGTLDEWAGAADEIATLLTEAGTHWIPPGEGYAVAALWPTSLSDDDRAIHARWWEATCAQSEVEIGVTVWVGDVWVCFVPEVAARRGNWGRVFAAALTMAAKKPGARASMVVRGTQLSAATPGGYWEAMPFRAEPPST